ncbi:MAG: ABC transporter permease, partial [Anaerolineales bacterium]|nr:ABC transporter permease [Anaerolineales bacterium]
MAQHTDKHKKAASPGDAHESAPHGNSADTSSAPANRGLRQWLAGHRTRTEAVLLPIMAVITALIIGAVIVAVSNGEVLAAWGRFFRDPLGAISITWVTVRDAGVALFQGSFGQPSRIVAAVGSYFGTGEARPLLDALRPFSESLVISTPYIFAGLAAAIGFRGGMFNIGAEGQLFVGGLASAFVGYSITGLPWIVHLPLALAAGTLAGAIWGAIPGLLKARTGAHEVINTIMMNYIAFRLTDFLLSGPMARPDGLPITPEVRPSAYLPEILPRPVRLHAGFFLALAMAALAWWFLWKTTKGFEIRMVGENPRAAR